MPFWSWWLLFTVIVVAAFIFKMWMKVKYPPAKQNKGTRPGQGETLIDTGMATNSFRPVINVTKDPKVYARGMMKHTQKDD